MVLGSGPERLARCSWLPAQAATADPKMRNSVQGVQLAGPTNRNVLCHCMAGRHRGASGAILQCGSLGTSRSTRCAARTATLVPGWRRQSRTEGALGLRATSASRLCGHRALYGGIRFEPLTSWKPSHGGALRAKDASAWQAPNGSRESELCSPDFPFLHS